MSVLLNPSHNPQSFVADVRVRAAEDDPLKVLRGSRILHVGKFYPPHRGGMETHVQSLCEELKRRGVDVEVIVANDTRRTGEEIVGGIKVTRLGTALNLSAAPVCPALLRKIREAKADLVHIHLPHPTAILAYLASGHPGPLVVTYHSDIIRQRILSRLFWPFLRRALTRADAIIVGSPNYLASSLVLKHFEEKCRVIPFGIPIEEFRQVDPEMVAGIRQRYGTRIVLGVGRLVYYKGFEYLIRAMKNVEGHLLIIGDGPLGDELQRETKNLGLTERVSFLKDVKDVKPYYHAADVFVLSSIARSEAFGIVQLEAMACGLPIVNTNLDSGVTYVSRDGETGRTVPPSDALALAVAINSIMDDSGLSEKMGQAGIERVEREFSLETMTRRTLELYGEVLRLRQRREAH